MKIRFLLILVLMAALVQAVPATRSAPTSSTYINCDSDHAYFSQDLILVSSPNTSDVYQATDTDWLTITTPITWTQLRVTPDKTIFVYDAANGLFYGSTDLGITWSISGTFPLASPYIDTRFAPSPIPRTLFVGVDDYSMQVPSIRGVYKTTDNGDHWINTGGVTGFAVVFSPNYMVDSIAYEEYGIYHGAGLNVTTNSGDSWSWAADGLTPSFYGLPFQIVFSPDYSDSKIVFAANESGLYKSINIGQPWSRLVVGVYSKPKPFRVALSPNHGIDHTLALIDSNSQLDLSQDDALTWQSIALPISTTARIAALRVVAPFEPPAPTPPLIAPYHVYLPIVNAAHVRPLEIWLIANDGESCKLYRSNNFGVTWQEEIVAGVK